MKNIIWTKANRSAVWVGSTAGFAYNEYDRPNPVSYIDRERYTITKVKPPYAPRTWAAKQRAKRLGQTWKYEYTLMERREDDPYVRRVGGRYPTLEAAKAHAEARVFWVK